MPFSDTFPLDFAPTSAIVGRGRNDALPADSPAADSTRFGLEDLPRVDFAGQAVVDEQGRAYAFDLWPLACRAGDLAQAEDVCLAHALAQALLDGSSQGQAPEAPLLVPMTATQLQGSIADAVTPSVGIIKLLPQVGADTPTLVRVSQLRARATQFCIAGLRDLDDPRWLLAPYADSMELDLHEVSPQRLVALADRAAEEGLLVIGKGVASMAGYQRLRELDVSLFQGRFISPAVTRSVPALPGCDGEVLARVRRLMASRVSPDAVAVAASADPALVLRLQLLHRVLGVHLAQPAPVTLAALLAGLAAPVWAGWLQVLSLSACHDGDRDWRASVRAQVDQYRRALCRRSPDEADSEREAALWAFQSRLCTPRHYFKTRRYLDERQAA